VLAAHRLAAGDQGWCPPALRPDRTLGHDVSARDTRSDGQGHGRADGMMPLQVAREPVRGWAELGRVNTLWRWHWLTATLAVMPGYREGGG